MNFLHDDDYSAIDFYRGYYSAGDEFVKYLLDVEKKSVDEVVEIMNERCKDARWDERVRKLADPEQRKQVKCSII